MARRPDKVARRKPDKEKIEYTVFDFGLFVHRTHPHMRMREGHDPAENSCNQQQNFNWFVQVGLPLKLIFDILAPSWTAKAHLNS
jgi:hypothetical protein